jgi:hypothetical protein
MEGGRGRRPPRLWDTSCDEPLPETAEASGLALEVGDTDEIEKNRTRPQNARRILDHDILPLLGERALDSITKLECRDV